MIENSEFSLHLRAAALITQHDYNADADGDDDNDDDDDVQWTLSTSMLPHSAAR